MWPEFGMLILMSRATAAQWEGHGSEAYERLSEVSMGHWLGIIRTELGGILCVSEPDGVIVVRGANGELFLCQIIAADFDLSEDALRELLAGDLEWERPVGPVEAGRELVLFDGCLAGWEALDEGAVEVIQVDWERSMWQTAFVQAPGIQVAFHRGTRTP